jgi:hypothetical protein
MWEFPILKKDDEFNGGAENFAIDRKVHNFVREAIQNVYDQRLYDKSSVAVSFDFYDLVGDDLNAFLKDIRWDEGLQKHITICSQSSNHDKQKIARNLEKFGSGVMRVLIVSDHRTEGLTGPEYGQGGNFCKLCRNKMIPSEGSGSHKRGGAFGVGKSVYWSFSGFNTVVFSSVYRDEKKNISSRVFGRTYLPDHENQEGQELLTYKGNGNMCRLEDDGGRHSMTLNEAGIKKGSLLYRDVENEDFGTTIAVIMYDERADGVPVPIAQVAKSFSDAIVANFWPMLNEKLLEATVSWTDSKNSSGTMSVDIPSEFDPFIRAANYSQDLDAFASNDDELLLDEGQVAFFESEIRIPQRTNTDDPHPAAPDAKVAVSITRLTESERDQLRAFEERYPDMKFVNRLANVRKPLMVVENREYVHGNCLDHVGVVRAGLFRSNSDDVLEYDKYVEQFLRDSEPPAHDKWTFTDKISSSYKTPWKEVVNNTYDRIGESAKRLLKAVLKGEQDRPNGLADLLAIKGGGGGRGGGGGGGGVVGAQFSSHVVEVEWDFVANQAICHVLVKRKKGAKKSGVIKDWTTEIHVEALGEQGNVILHLLKASCDNGLAAQPVGSAMNTTSYTVSIPSNIDNYNIYLTASLNQLSDVVAKRVRIDAIASSRETK